LTTSDDQKYLKVCVTPSNGWITGTEVCSNWSAVGHTMKIYENGSYGGTSLVVAWEKSAKETCFNLTDYSFNDKMSSYAWTNNSNASSTVTFYKDINCSGTSATRTVSASSSESVSSVNTTLGTGWNDTASSYKVSWSSSITISTPSLTISGNTATESHTYSDTNGMSEDATYTWYRASDSSGTGSTELDNFNSNTYTLGTGDENKYLKVCVLSSNGVVVDEAQSCSSWVSVGPLVTLYSDVNQGGTSISIAYKNSASGTCFNLSTFNDITSSYTALGTTGGGTLYTYKHADCNDSSVTTQSLSSASSESGNFSGSYNDSRSSIKVVY